MARLDAITAIEGLRVGHWTDLEAATGCTVVLCEESAVAACDVRGGAPGTRETDALQPSNLVEKAHAILLSGGSAFGLEAATGVMRYLEERGVGFPTITGPIPIVAAAVLYDLAIGRSDIRPGAAAGYAACQAAVDSRSVEEGSVGAGTGATVAKALGLQRALKGGLGTACERMVAGAQVGVIVAVNCFGDVVNPDTGEIIAAPRDEDGRFVSTLEILRSRPAGAFAGFSNSTLAVVATDAVLTREQAQRLAVMAHDGLARCLRPVHTLVDGDCIFALATGRSPVQVDITALGAIGARAVERAVLRAVRVAKGLAGVPSVSELPRG